MDRAVVNEYGRNLISSIMNGQRVLFITTKNLDYIRNTQEINIIKKVSRNYKVIGSSNSSYLIRVLKVYKELLFVRAKDFDTIFIGFSPQLILPIWSWKFRKNEVIIDFFISMYDTFVCDRKKFRESSVVSKVLKVIDRLTLKRANKIVTDTEAHGNFFAEELGAEKNKLITLYLEADREIYFEHNVQRGKKLKDKFIVLYFGSVLPLQGIDTVLGAYNLLKDDSRIYMYMIGKIGDQYEKPKSKNIEYIDWLSQEKLANYIGTADLCLAGHFNGDIGKAKRTIPGKAYIYHAMNKKIIFGDSPANHELFSEDDPGVYFVEMSNSKALANKIISILNEGNRTKENEETCIFNYGTQ